MLRIVRQETPVQLLPGHGLFLGDREMPVHFVFPVLHGPFGEDGTLQGLLEMLDLPYAGADVLGSALAMDKEQAKTVWRARGIPILDFLMVRRHEFADTAHRQDLLQSVEKRLPLPVFVKPARTGSSVGVGRADNREELSRVLERALHYDTKALVERAADAREIECAVIGNDPVLSFPPGEIVSSHAFYSYEAKYLDPAGARPVIPAELPASLAGEARTLAERAYRALGVTGFARVDLFLERGTDRFYLNEINSIPGFTNISMFPRLCETGGLPYRDLIDRLIEYGFERHRERTALDYGFR
jgi:D-alanine-D-alanine ligase